MKMIKKLILPSLPLLPAVSHAADELNTGDTAWVLISTALVLMMTLPGLALFYAGIVRKKNILSTMMHSYGAAAVVSVMWVLVGYSLAFSEGSMSAFVGGLGNVMLAGVGMDAMSGTIPTILFVACQIQLIYGVFCTLGCACVCTDLPLGMGRRLAHWRCA